MFDFARSAAEPEPYPTLRKGNGAAPEAPASVAVDAVSATTLVVSWPVAAGADGYEVEESTDGATWTQVAVSVGTSIVRAGHSPARRYYYRIRAFNAAGTSASSPSEYAAPWSAGNTTYFVDLNGDDDAAGTTAATAWSSIARVNEVRKAPGDTIQFRGEQTFAGTLTLTEGGSSTHPITVGSFGTGRATIDAGDGSAVYVLNAAGVRVQDLIVAGSGYPINRGNGIEFRITLPDAAKLSWVRISNVRASGFSGPATHQGFGLYGRGISVRTDSDDGSQSGYDDVLIEGCETYGNTYYGIAVSGAYDTAATERSHANVTVRNCIAYHNPGHREWLRNHSGSGIFVFGVEGALIQFCRAWGNGAQGGIPGGGGPVGIWFAGVKNGKIQHCESHDNRTRTGDGGGFDLDGGCEACTIEWCYSHGNDGAGFLVYEYEGSVYTMRNNTIRFCVSEHDARKNQSYYGSGITIHTLEPNSHTKAYCNTIYNSGPAEQFAVRCITGQNIEIRNNIIIAAAGRLLLVESEATSGLRVQGNDWYAPSGWSIRVGTTDHRTLAAFRSSGGDRERITVGGATTDTGTTVDPRLVDAGGGGTVGSTIQPWSLPAYRLRIGSPMPAAGIDLRPLYVLPRVDFHGVPIPASGAFLAVGAASTADAPARGPYAIPPLPGVHLTPSTALLGSLASTAVAPPEARGIRAEEEFSDRPW